MKWSIVGVIAIGGFLASLWALGEVNGDPGVKLILYYACACTLIAPAALAKYAG